MTAKITIDDREARAVLNIIGDINAFKPAMVDSLALVHKDMTKQPRKDGTAFSRLATPGQKRAYWAKVASGEARHGPNGYVRSGALKRGWSIEPIQKTMNSLRGVVKNTAAHAVFVQGSRRQPFHAATGWITDALEVERRRRRIVGIFRKRAKEIVRGLNR